MKKRKLNLLPEIKKLVERPFEEKLLQTDLIIEENLRKYRDHAAIAWSGGKDSTLVVAITRELWPDIPVVFNNTGVEYPETIRFIHELAAEWKLNFFETKPNTTFWKVADKFGYPQGTKHGRKKDIEGRTNATHCCYYLKEKPMYDEIRKQGFEAVFDGVTASESWVRMFAARMGTCYQYKHWNIQKVHPILYWTEEEVTDYIESEGIPNNPLYSKGFERVGCMTCTAWKYWEEEMAALKPKLYAIIKLRKDRQYTMTL